MIETLCSVVDAGHQPGQQGVAGLVVGGHRLLLAGEHLVALGAHEDFVAGVLEVGHVDAVLVVAAGPERGLVDQVADVGAGQADGAGGEPLQVDVVGQRHVARVDLEDGQPALVGGPIDRDVAVEAAGAQQGRIEHVGPVRGGHDDDRLGLGEAVHFAEDLVERLLAFVVAAAHAGAAMPADGVDLVDEEDAGGVFLGGGEQVADAAGAHADEHLDELGAVDGDRRARPPRRPPPGPAASCPCPAGPSAGCPWARGRPAAGTSGFFRNSTISSSSRLTPSRPATSSKVIGRSPCS